MSSLTVRLARLLGVDDAGPIRRGVATLMGKRRQDVMVFSPYGLEHNPPDGSLSIALAAQDQDSNLITLNDDPNRRVFQGDTALKSGETALTNYLTRASFHHREDGDTAGDIPRDLSFAIGRNVTFNLPADGTFTINIGAASFAFSEDTLTVTGADVIADGISLRTHIHTGDDGGNTSGPR